MSTGTGRLYRRGKVWWLDYSFRGKRVRESSKSHRKKDAQALLRRRMAEIGKGRLIGPDAEKVTLGELGQILVKEYKANERATLDRAKLALGHLTDFLGEQARAVDITTDRLDGYVAHRRQEGRAPATIRRELATLKRAFTLAKKARRIGAENVPAFPEVEVNNVREGFFSSADLATIIAELPEDVKPVVRFAALTGWRKGEVLSLQWSRVDFEAGEVRLAPGTTKNREGRTFPFHALPDLAALMEERRTRTRELEKQTGEIIPWVFHRDGTRIRSIRTAWNGAAKRAGMEGALFHDLRRTAVRNLEAAGVSRSVAMKLTGHKTEAVYRRYAIADRVALEEGVAKLAQHHGAASKQTRTVVPIQEAKGA